MVSKGVDLQNEMSLQLDGRVSVESPPFHCPAKYAKFQAGDKLIRRPRPISKPTPSSFFLLCLSVRCLRSPLAARLVVVRQQTPP